MIVFILYSAQTKQIKSVKHLINQNELIVKVLYPLQILRRNRKIKNTSFSFFGCNPKSPLVGFYNFFAMC